VPLAELLMAAMWICLTAYALFGGADFGGGFWDLVAGQAEKGKPQRNLIEHSIGPIWEANHVWLIFVIILTWTMVPSVFAAVSSTLYIPLTLVALGIIARGSAFAFRKVSQELWQQRLFGGAFAFSSVLTPFFLGAVGGSLAAERVPPGIAAGDPIASWINPTSITSGFLAVATTTSRRRLPDPRCTKGERSGAGRGLPPQGPRLGRRHGSAGGCGAGGACSRCTAAVQATADPAGPAVRSPVGCCRARLPGADVAPELPYRTSLGCPRLTPCCGAGDLGSTPLFSPASPWPTPQPPKAFWLPTRSQYWSPGFW